MISDKEKVKKYIWAAFLLIYIFAVLYLTGYRGRFDFEIFTNGGLFKNGKLFPVPFVHMRWAYLDYPPYFVRSLLENIVMFIPVGIALGKVSGGRMTIWKIIAVGFALSLTIEFLQYMFGTGESETDDLIVNTFSAFLGGEIYWISEKHLKYKRNKDEKRGKGITDGGE